MAKLARGYFANQNGRGSKMKERAQLILYSKPGCHLCEEMKAEISKANCAALYELQEINIESDAELFARYRNDIPVLSINGVEAFKHRLSSADFRNALRHVG
jgi:hypothetical protein